MMSAFEDAAVRGHPFATLILIRLRDTWTESDGQQLRAKGVQYQSDKKPEALNQSEAGQAMLLSEYEMWEKIVEAAEVLRNSAGRDYLRRLMQELPKINRPHSMTRFLSTQPEEEQVTFWDAVTLLTQNIEFAKHLQIQDKSMLENRNQFGETPLLAACHKGWTPLVRMLLYLGADGSVTDNTGVSGLHYLFMAFEHSKAEAAQLLLRQGAKMSQVGKDWVGDVYLEGTPLHWAIKMRSISTIELLIDLGADVNDQIWSLTPLQLATHCCYPELTKLILIKKSAKHQSTSISRHSFGQTLARFLPGIHQAEQQPRQIDGNISDSSDELESIISILGHRSFFKTRFLHGNEFEQDVEGTLKAYVESGININEINDSAVTLLHLAAVPIVDDLFFDVLMRKGPNKYIQDSDGRSVLDWLLYAARGHSGNERGAVQKLRILRGNGYPFPERRRESKDLPLFQCASKNFPLMAEELILNGFNIESPTIMHAESSYPHGKRQKYDFNIAAS